MAATLVLGGGTAGVLAAGLVDREPSEPDVVLDGVRDTGGAPTAGTVGILRNIDPAFAPFISDSTPEIRQFINENYDRIRGFAPFQDQALEWGPPTRVYQDLYAIYDTDRDRDRPTLENLDGDPDWVLRDGDGEALYIPFDCEEGGCPQLAADPGNEDWRRQWITTAIERLDRGYAGVFVDDVNTAMRVSDGSGEQVAPIDPRTGRPMTLAAWRRYIAEFVEEIEVALRAHDPEVEISHNPLWFEPEDDPSVLRQTLAADVIQLERGFNDRGLRGGAGRFGFETFLAHVDWLHSLGRAALYKPDAFDEAGRDYELASYFLVSEPGDAIAPESFIDPGDYWAGWDVDLGEPQGDRYLWRDGLLRRDFERGFTVVNQPDRPAVEVALRPGSTDPAGELISSLSLPPRSGQVVIEP